MSKPLEQREIEARVRSQQDAIRLRKDFLGLNKPTQQAIIDTLTKAGELISDDPASEIEAQLLVQQIIHSNEDGHYGLKLDANGVNWDEVEWHIQSACYTPESDMGIRLLVGRRVWSECTVLSSLIGDDL